MPFFELTSAEKELGSLVFGSAVDGTTNATILFSLLMSLQTLGSPMEIALNHSVSTSGVAGGACAVSRHVRVIGPREGGHEAAGETRGGCSRGGAEPGRNALSSARLTRRADRFCGGVFSLQIPMSAVSSDIVVSSALDHAMV